jgi:GNAT superfamily N-acetyltransferase
LFDAHPQKTNTSNCGSDIVQTTPADDGGFTMLDQDSDSLRIAWAESDADIWACLPVLREFWPHIGNQGDFVACVRHLQEHGYRLMAAWSGNRVVACAGYQLEENLIRGRYLHINELVTTRSARSQGIGQHLLDILLEEARKFDCRALMLECGLLNSRAHRFYFREGLRITAFRFAVPFDSVHVSE